jgi:hypothetical protein
VAGELVALAKRRNPVAKEDSRPNPTGSDRSERVKCFMSKGEMWVDVVS